MDHEDHGNWHDVAQQRLMLAEQRVAQVWWALDQAEQRGETAKSLAALEDIYHQEVATFAAAQPTWATL